MFQNFGKIHFWNCYDLEVDKELILKIFCLLGSIYIRKFSNKMQIRNQHDQDTDNDLIFQTVSFRPQLTSIRKFFEIITMKESIKNDSKKLLVQFDLLQYRKYFIKYTLEIITSKQFMKIRISKSKQTKIFEIWIFKSFSVIISNVDFIKKNFPVYVNQSECQYLSVAKKIKDFKTKVNVDWRDKWRLRCKFEANIISLWSTSVGLEKAKA